MRRKVNAFLVLVDEDGVPGFNSGLRAKDDIVKLLTSHLRDMLPSYNVQVSSIGDFDRASNFTRPVNITFSLSLDILDEDEEFYIERIPVSHESFIVRYDAERK